MFLIALTAAVLLVSLILPAAASSAPRLLTSAKNLEALAIDGANLYWTDARSVTRVDINSGLGTVIYRAPRNGSIGEIVAGGGRLGILTNVGGKKTLKTKLLAYTAASGQLQALASGKAKVFKKSALCGSELSLGNVTDAGEIVALRSVFSLSRKKCRKPLSFSSTVTGFAPGGSRTLFSEQYTGGGVLGKLGSPVFYAELSGDKLALTGAGIGILDLASQQFVLVRPPASRSLYLGMLDMKADLLVNALNFRSNKSTVTLFDVESGYLNSAPVANGNSFLFVRACGSSLLQSQYNFKRGSSASVTITPNPLVPGAPAGSQPLAPTSAQELAADACDATNAAYALYGGSSSTASVFLAPLSG